MTPSSQCNSSVRKHGHLELCPLSSFEPMKLTKNGSNMLVSRRGIEPGASEPGEGADTGDMYPPLTTKGGHHMHLYPS